MSKLPRQVQAQADALVEYDKSQEIPAPAPEVVAEAPPEPEPAPPPIVEPVKPPAPDPWEHKFRTLQGIFNTQVPSLQGEVKELRAKLEQLESAKPVTSEATENLVTDKDKEGFGEDLIDLARRISREEGAKERKAYQQQIIDLSNKLAEQNKKTGQVAEAVQRSTFDSFLGRLEVAVPGWETIQGTEECQAWLGTRVPGTQIDWDTALKNSANRQDVDATTEVFQAFFDKYPAYNPNKAAPVDKMAALAREVSPSKPRGGNLPAAPANKKFYSSAEYAARSTEQLRLEKAGKRDQANAIEAELNAAIVEGRVGP